MSFSARGKQRKTNKIANVLWNMFQFQRSSKLIMVHDLMKKDSSNKPELLTDAWNYFTGNLLICSSNSFSFYRKNITLPLLFLLKQKNCKNRHKYLEKIHSFTASRCVTISQKLLNSAFFRLRSAGSNTTSDATVFRTNGAQKSN